MGYRCGQFLPKYFYFSKNEPFQASFFFIFVFSTVNRKRGFWTKFCQLLDLNRRPLLPNGYDSANWATANYALHDIYYFCTSKTYRISLLCENIFGEIDILLWGLCMRLTLPNYSPSLYLERSLCGLGRLGW